MSVTGLGNEQKKKFFFQRVKFLYCKLDQYANFQCLGKNKSILGGGLLLTLIFLPTPALNPSQ
jgi:hypothetical protein